MTGIVAYVLSKSYVKKSLAGLGALRGSPCMIKSIVPHYSALDPTKVVDYDITLMWDSNNDPDPSHIPEWHEEMIQSLDMGRGVYEIEYNPALSTAEKLKYDVTFYDGTQTQFDIPATSGAMKKKVVMVLPLPAAADHNTIYLVPVPGKPGVYEQWLTVEDDATHAWEWLSLGSTEMDLTGYQHEIDENIIKKTYPNYDPDTKGATPKAPNVVGAINEFEIELGANYDYNQNKVANLKTYHKATLVDAINDMGNLEDLEMWDPGTGKPETIVDAINLANEDYEIKARASVDKSKYIDNYDLIKDPQDGSPVIKSGDVIEIPRVDVTKQAAPTQDAQYVDYRTYNVRMAGELSDPDDAANVPYGTIHLPQYKLAKKIPTQTAPVTEGHTIQTADWTVVAPNKIEAKFNLNSMPAPWTTPVVTPTSGVPAGYNLSYAYDRTEVTVTCTGGAVVPYVQDLRFDYEVETLSAQYYLQIEGRNYDASLCGVTIDIEKNSLLKDVTLEVVEFPNVPYPGAAVGDRYLDFWFVLADGSDKHTYVPVKDLFDPYVGVEAIDISFDVINKQNVVSLVINNPYIGTEQIPILSQDADGLTINIASHEQYGAVEYATDAEVLADPQAATVVKVVKPYDVYHILYAGTAIAPELSGLYVRDGETEFVNNTVTKAINEIATNRIEKRADTALKDENLAEYQLETLPESGVKRQMGDAIEIPKPIIETDTLTGYTDPKDYFLYYLTKFEDPRQPGMYKYFDNDWVKVGGLAIEYCTALEDLAAPEEDHFYGVLSGETVLSRWTLSEKAYELGWRLLPDGLHDPDGNIHSWPAVLIDFMQYQDDELVPDEYGEVAYITHEDGTPDLIYGYTYKPESLYFIKNGKWYTAYSVPVITLEELDALDIED